MDYTLSDLESAFYAGVELKSAVEIGGDYPKRLGYTDFKSYISSLEALRQQINHKEVSKYQFSEKPPYKRDNEVLKELDNKRGHNGC